ncbi:PSD1 and planctomycete cytochrome C domain-containing protein [Zavarzinella formosa]|uniref:PSD1 and planctomycete cytochrome C domain-containing protein n=1 Tax=Zavarzinella formosa TaxID=360055 RepID=UPI0002F8EDA4|nr:PSD1 and planctomycete cytochrome C domain-containing protein [Zavarzinella formosa]
MNPRLALCCLGLFPFAGLAADPNVEFFENKIRPVLVEQCLSCHGEKKQAGGLRLDTKQAVLKGGDTGPALIAGKPTESLMIKAIKQDGELKMPPKGKLPASVVADLTKWVETGAVDPRDGTAQAASSIDWAKGRKFWSFQPVVKPAVPAVAGATPIDRFINAKLAAQGLKPVAIADKRMLIRRITFDLTGLPPTPEEVAAYLADSSPDADAKLIDRLLNSPAYGETQARHWLDVARYAEDQAHTFGVAPSTDAWRYRDWVIDAFNEDMRFDRFAKLQIAADFLTGDTPDEIKHRAALGFFGLGAVYYKNSDAAKAAADELDDRVDTLTRGFLGLTVSCARCHDHKFDPIPTQDYYSLAGIFTSTKLDKVPLAPKAEMEKIAASQKKIQEADKLVKALLQTAKDKLAVKKAEELSAYLLAAWKLEARRMEKNDAPANEIAKAEKLDGPTLDRMSKMLKNKGANMPGLADWAKNLPKKGDKNVPDTVQALAAAWRDTVKTVMADAKHKNRNEVMNALFGDKGVFILAEGDAVSIMPPEEKTKYDGLKTEHAKLVKEAPPTPSMVHGISETNPVDLKVYIRGNPAKQGELAPRRFLKIIAGDDPVKFKQGSGRKELADAVADPKNPLTARVFVNRVWQQHFGRGIVGTPSNFGSMGERPTHPELLDYLAASFIENGWSVKKLHREILLSETYRRASVPDEANMQKDADNRFLWRSNRRRLTVESWRDALLAASGKLDPKLGGPTTNLDTPENARRTVYARISRHELNGLLRLFDFPDANITSERRVETTVPQQQLFVMNSPFMVNQARALSGRLEKEAPTEDARIRRAYEILFGRPALPEEVDIGLKYLTMTESKEEAGKNKLSRKDRYYQALLASNEFLYVD